MTVWIMVWDLGLELMKKIAPNMPNIVPLLHILFDAIDEMALNTDYCLLLNCFSLD